MTRDPSDTMKPFGVTSRGIAERRFIDTHLSAPVEFVGRWHRASGERYQAIAGWGHKRSGQAARALAAETGLPCLLLEDGFLRSAGDGVDPQALSLAVDDLGIYYDAREPSRLESLIAQGCPAHAHDRATQLIAAWRAHRVSKYNHARDSKPDADDYVLVVDQTRGDASIDGALATPRSFRTMLEAALDEHPGRDIVLKLHPDVLAGRKHGHFDAATAGVAARVKIVGTQVHAPDLIERSRAVYTVGSQIGFEALIWGRDVCAFGMPFYAGWGLTRDALAAPGRRAQRTLEDLVFASLVQYPRYVDPETGARCEVETVLEHIGLQRRMRSRFPATIHAIGLSRWKKPIARAYFGGSDLKFVRGVRALPRDASAVAVWGRKECGTRGSADRRVIRIEDGFVRSVGLGALLIRPSSWVLDDLGLYYDATCESGIEKLLNETVFDAPLLMRARTLRERMVDRGLSKYNLQGAPWTRPDTTRRVILAVGQVEGDASLQYGGVAMKTNLALLETVRRNAPDAYIVFKPHPDVVAGLRDGQIPAPVAARLCDRVLDSESIVDVVRGCDEVHVMTSLTGFEALLHGKSVTTYGMPFYAGWGLTTDLFQSPRRRRTITLDMLVAVTLILYPTYISAATGRFTTPERIVAELEAARETGGSQSARSGALSACLRIWLRIAARWKGLRAGAKV